MIEFVLHKNIDKSRWDQCVSTASNGLIYGLYDYISSVAPQWNAIIINNYAAVMPLPYTSKWGLKYIYHPFFAQQLGVFIALPIPFTWHEIQKKIPLKYLKYNISFNTANQFNFDPAFHRVNYFLDLNSSYEMLARKYNTNTKRNLNKTKRANLKLVSEHEASIAELLKLRKENPVNLLTKTHFEILNNLFQYLAANKLAQIYSVQNEADETIASAIITKFKNRLIYLFSASNQEGKSKGAMFLIIDYLVMTYSNSNFILDFEGSMVSGVAQFFKGFGATPEYYYRINNFNIPFIR